MRHAPIKVENYEDAALLEGAAVILRRAALDLEEASKKGQTGYAEDAFTEVFSLIDDAVSTLSSAATKATENAASDAADDLADRLYEDRMDD